MICLFCKYKDTDVIETRDTESGTIIRRRRQCPKCKKRFTTYERVEDLPLLVIKRDGQRERFDTDKLRRGILKATGKTSITLEQIEKIISLVESELKQGEETEIESKVIGQMVAKHLKKLDKVAYIRFASVFQRFVDVEDFEKEVKKLL